MHFFVRQRFWPSNQGFYLYLVRLLYLKSNYWAIEFLSSKTVL
jgi:hypothetical protein